MFLLALAATAVASLGPRPAAITGPDAAAYSAWLAAKTVEFDAQFTGSPCDDATVTSLGGTDAGAPFFNAPAPDSFEPTSWIEHLRVEGCGRTRLPNTLVLRLSSGGWRAVGLLDGESNADPLLQIETSQTAKLFLTAQAACGRADAGETLRMGAVTVLSPRNRDGAWTERWPATVCGKPVAVDVRFTPDPAGGTTFSVTASSAKPGG